MNLFYLFPRFRRFLDVIKNIILFQNWFHFHDYSNKYNIILLIKISFIVFHLWFLMYFMKQELLSCCLTIWSFSLKLLQYFMSFSMYRTNDTISKRIENAMLKIRRKSFSEKMNLVWNYLFKNSWKTYVDYVYQSFVKFMIKLNAYKKVVLFLEIIIISIIWA